MFHETSPASYIASMDVHSLHTLSHRHSKTHPSYTHTHSATPSTAIQHLNWRAIPVRVLNTTDWDEWQTSSASISPLILLVGQLSQIRYPRGYCCRWPQGTLNGFKGWIWRPGGSACWDTYHKDVGLNSGRHSCCTYPACHSALPITSQCEEFDGPQEKWPPS